MAMIAPTSAGMSEARSASRYSRAEYGYLLYTESKFGGDAFAPADHIRDVGVAIRRRIGLRVTPANSKVVHKALFRDQPKLAKMPNDTSELKAMPHTIAQAKAVTVNLLGITMPYVIWARVYDQLDVKLQTTRSDAR